MGPCPPMVSEQHLAQKRAELRQLEEQAAVARAHAAASAAPSLVPQHVGYIPIQHRRMFHGSSVSTSMPQAHHASAQAVMVPAPGRSVAGPMAPVGSTHPNAPPRPNMPAQPRVTYSAVPAATRVGQHSMMPAAQFVANGSLGPQIFQPSAASITVPSRMRTASALPNPVSTTTTAPTAVALAPAPASANSTTTPCSSNATNPSSLPPKNVNNVPVATRPQSISSPAMLALAPAPSAAPRMTYRVLFLDVDGVLNCPNPWTCLPSHVGNAAALDAGALARGALSLDPALVERLSKLVRDTGSHIVLSSAWRLHPTARRELARILSNHGIGKALLGVTSSPAVRPNHPSGAVLASEAAKARCCEILHWLCSHPDLVATWAAVDHLDLRDLCTRQWCAHNHTSGGATTGQVPQWPAALNDVLRRFVSTDQTLGLTEKDAAELSCLLSSANSNVESVPAVAAAVSTVLPCLEAPIPALAVTLPPPAVAPPPVHSLPVLPTTAVIAADTSNANTPPYAKVLPTPAVVAADTSNANAPPCVKVLPTPAVVAADTSNANAPPCAKDDCSVNSKTETELASNAALLTSATLPQSICSSHDRSSGSAAKGAGSIVDAPVTAQLSSSSAESDEDSAPPAPTVSPKCAPVAGPPSGGAAVVAPCSAGVAAPPSPQLFDSDQLKAYIKESPPSSPNMASMMLEIAATLTQLGGAAAQPSAPVSQSAHVPQSAPSRFAKASPSCISQASIHASKPVSKKRNLVQKLVATQGEGDSRSTGGSHKRRVVVHESAMGADEM